MSEIDEQNKRAREKTARYNQMPDRKEARGVEYALRSHRLTLATTVKRIQSHTLSDLVEVARMCCQDNPGAFSENQDVIIKALAILHSGGNVQNESPSEDIAVPKHLAKFLTSTKT